LSVLTVQSDLFHIAVRDSQGDVVEFGSFGVRSSGASTDHGPDESRPAWHLAKPVRLFPKLCAKGGLQASQAEPFARWWDHTLHLMLHSPQVMDRFSAAAYEPITRNCFSFVLTFLKLLRIDALDPWLHSRAVFTQTFLIDELQPIRSANNRKFA
jgi:hypothetical protein